MKNIFYSRILLMVTCCIIPIFFISIQPAVYAINSSVGHPENLQEIFSKYGIVQDGTKKISKEKQAENKGDVINQLSRQEAIEVMEKRTEYSKYYELGNGKVATIISATPIHFEDNNGNFHEISTKLFETSAMMSLETSIVENVSLYHANYEAYENVNADELFTAYQVPFGNLVSKKFNDGYSVTNENDTLTFKPVGSNNVKGTLNDENQVLYVDPWKDTDVILEVNEVGVKETIVLKSKEAPNMFSYEISEKVSEDLTLGELSIQPAWLIDAKGIYRDVSQTLRTEDGKTYIDLEVSTEGLLFPIFIDPTITVSPLSIATVSEYREFYPDSRTSNTIRYSSREVEIGYELYFGNVEYMYTSNGLIKFDLSSLSSNLTVNNATILGMPEIYNLSSPKMVTQEWSKYIPQTNSNISLIDIINEWITGAPNHGIMFSSSSYPTWYNFSNAYLYIEGYLEDRNPSAPENLRITSTTHDSISLSWDLSTDNTGILKYMVFNEDHVIDTISGDKTTYIIQGAKTGLYSLSIVAVDENGNNSERSNVINYYYGKKTTYKYNEKNQLIEVMREGSSTKEYIYDNNGNLVMVRNKN